MLWRQQAGGCGKGQHEGPNLEDCSDKHLSWAAEGSEGLAGRRPLVEQLDGEDVQEGHCDPREGKEGAMAQRPIALA